MLKIVLSKAGSVGRVQLEGNTDRGDLPKGSSRRQNFGLQKTFEVSKANGKVICEYNL